MLYAFDPQRTAILLIGGDKTGNNRWYEKFIPVADDLYDQHIEALKKRGENIMSKPFKKLIEKMPVERQERINRMTKDIKTQMALRELRKALEMTQEQLAEALSMNQAAISKFEHQSDIYIGTLRRILSAMGAELKIVAQFPDAEVTISQFTDLQQAKVAQHQDVAC